MIGRKKEMKGEGKRERGKRREVMGKEVKREKEEEGRGDLK